MQTLNKILLVTYGITCPISFGVGVFAHRSLSSNYGQRYHTVDTGFQVVPMFMIVVPLAPQVISCTLGYSSSVMFDNFLYKFSEKHKLEADKYLQEHGKRIR